MKNWISKVIHFFAKKSFNFFAKHFGLHITPVHFYSPIPVTCELDFKRL